MTWSWTRATPDTDADGGDAIDPALDPDWCVFARSASDADGPNHRETLHAVHAPTTPTWLGDRREVPLGIIPPRLVYLDPAPIPIHLQHQHL